jgi:hypothetical protein
MFHAIFGARVVDEVRRLVETGFTAADDSWLVEPLRDMFLPEGRIARRALALADARYARIFAGIAGALAGRSFYFIDGNMDYPALSRERAAVAPGLVPIAETVVTVDGITLAGLGGIPNTAHPYRGVVEISPNEMSEEEYERRLESLPAVDVLCTHLSPEEAPALGRFLDRGGARVLVCRAPFDFRDARDFRGRNAIRRRGDAHVITVRPFEWPNGGAFVLDLAPGAPPHLEVWSYAGASAAA